MLLGIAVMDENPFEPSLSPGRWTAGPRFGINTTDIAGRSHPLPNSIRKDQNERASHVLPWLTGTAPRGGLGVWVLSQKQASAAPLPGAFVAVPTRAFSLLASSLQWLARPDHCCQSIPTK